MLKKLLGLAPQPTKDGAFIPSKLALKLATSDKTDFDGSIYQNTYQGSKKILMICTEQQNMTMANGTKFSTGNHPVEMLLPMLHLKNAGFDVDIYTPTGKSVKIEMWAMPQKDENVQKIYSEYQSQFENPKSLADFVQHKINDNDDYVAVFIPGGHGAMLGLPEDKNLSQLIHWSHKKDLYMMAICHAPAALLSANLDTDKDFIYKGYKMAAFPDSVDKQTPMIGYMPGDLTWKFGETLENLGVTFVNKKADKTCYIDRKLITGASPQAANDFGKLCAEELLKSINK
ncbi:MULTISPECIES: glyoxalase III HchA [Pasteurellaceae]|uniref:Protein deglycase HchA n=1 Tax=Pasteurella atlantica TaxID=2827233 RepID=A0AAW8CIJ9_9PAST|nr:glyoxalase III HchA [Pasteurella atlantica]MBR0572621.1 protein deglycase HchA [Pasteurella atlantica]MDP8038567.1 protein deglycase HchA [Pasteurella atlantica]MDP8040659.1 protein deglycase HchA [Pasteurella atlantica]MDP8042794.1 protein deglycase HchA [Pasteurella atlantica]MDP8044881.1 protein deglycase HchA [Pasteurella atlantica]